MEKSYPMPKDFSGRKFAARYGLDTLNGDFWADDQFLYIRDGITLPDDPPIFETPDPPKPATSVRLDGVTDLPSLIIILKEVLR
jgi:hypothetical protein